MRAAVLWLAGAAVKAVFVRHDLHAPSVELTGDEAVSYEYLLQAVGNESPIVQNSMLGLCPAPRQVGIMWSVKLEKCNFIWEKNARPKQKFLWKFRKDNMIESTEVPGLCMHHRMCFSTSNYVVDLQPCSKATEIRTRNAVGEVDDAARGPLLASVIGDMEDPVKGPWIFDLAFSRFPYDFQANGKTRNRAYFNPTQNQMADTLGLAGGMKAKGGSEQKPPSHFVRMGGTTSKAECGSLLIQSDIAYWYTRRFMNLTEWLKLSEDEQRKLRPGSFPPKQNATNTNSTGNSTSTNSTGGNATKLAPPPKPMDPDVKAGIWMPAGSFFQRLFRLGEVAGALVF